MNTSNEISVRLATLEDTISIASFNVAMALETENKVIAQTQLEQGVARMVGDPSLGFYLVAQHHGETRGCLGVTFEWSDWRNGLFWWIQSVYVESSARGSGIFTAMYNDVSARAQITPEVIGLRLYADADNQRAIRTYHHLGMTTTDYHLLEVELPSTPS